MNPRSLRSLSIALIATLQLVLAPLGSMAHCSGMGAPDEDCCCASEAPAPEPESCCAAADEGQVPSGDEGREGQCGCSMDAPILPLPPEAVTPQNQLEQGQAFAAERPAVVQVPGSSVAKAVRVRLPGGQPPRHLLFSVFRL